MQPNQPRGANTPRRQYYQDPSRGDWPEVPLDEAFRRAPDAQVNDAILTREFAGEPLRANLLPATDWRGEVVAFFCYRTKERETKQPEVTANPSGGWRVGSQRVLRPAAWVTPPSFFRSSSNAISLMESPRWPEAWVLGRFDERFEVYDMETGEQVTAGTTAAEAIAWAALSLVAPERLARRPVEEDAAADHEES